MTFSTRGKNELEYGPNPQHSTEPEGKMNFLEAAGAQGTQGWGVGDREPSLGMKLRHCSLCSSHRPLSYQ